MCIGDIMDNRTCACAYVMWHKYAAIATKTYLGVIPKDLINAYISRMIAYLGYIDCGNVSRLKVGSKKLELVKKETGGILPHEQTGEYYEYNFWRETDGFFISGSDLMYFKNGECVAYVLGNKRGDQWVRCGLYFICCRDGSTVDGKFYCIKDEEFVYYTFPSEIDDIYSTHCGAWACIYNFARIFLTDFSTYPLSYKEIFEDQTCIDDLEYIYVALKYDSKLEEYSEADHVSDCEYFSDSDYASEE